MGTFGCRWISVSEIVTSARSDLLTARWWRIYPAVWTLVVATAGPRILPCGTAICARVTVDERRLAVGLVVPLMFTALALLKQQCGPWLGLPPRMLKSACPR